LRVFGDGDHRSGGPSRALVARRAIATAASLFAVWVFVQTLGVAYHRADLRWLPAALLTFAPLLAAVSIWSRRVGAQLLARGIWWSLLLLGGLVALMERKDYSGCGIALASACSLITAGRTGLDGEGGRFQPVAFRGTLTLALIMAIADTATCFWMGVGQVTYERTPRVFLLVPFMIAGIVGLLRLRTWGLLVSLACNALVAILAWTGTLRLHEELRPLLIGTALVQLVVPIPMWIAIARHRIPPPDAWRRTKLVVSTAVILAIAATSVALSLLVERSVYTY
jgi:hypothetical protein